MTKAKKVSREFRFKKFLNDLVQLVQQNQMIRWGDAEKQAQNLQKAEFGRKLGLEGMRKQIFEHLAKSPVVKSVDGNTIPVYYSTDKVGKFPKGSGIEMYPTSTWHIYLRTFTV